MLLHWIWLAHRPGLSDRGKASLLQHFSDPEEIYFADPKSYEGIENVSPTGKEGLLDKSLTQAQEILDACREKNIRIVTFQDAAYPRRLKHIADPPVVLYYKGRIPDLESHPAIAVVGTRKASAYGLTTAKRMGYQIADCGGIVVSGMAYGIDGMAMSGALTAGRPVIGVLGCGADIVYPVSNQSLFRDVEKYGCIFSEFPPGTMPARWTFPKRNRIISGLSNGVLVIEAPEKSGALITARQGADQGRDVFVVPGNIDLPSFQGSNQLLRDGAAMASCGWDVVGEYAYLYPGKLHPGSKGKSLTAYPAEIGQTIEQEASLVAERGRLPGSKQELKKKLDKKDIDKQASTPYSGVKTKLPPLSPEEETIVAALETGERLVDDVIADTGLPTGKLLSALTMLELKGVIRRLPGKRIALRSR